MATELDLGYDGTDYFVTASFTDEDGNAVTPDAATWSLYDETNTIVGTREDIAITGLSTSVTVQIAGQYMYAGSDPRGKRKFVLQTTYDSTKTKNAQAEFEIENILGVSAT
jgi:hypothetical protein